MGHEPRKVRLHGVVDYLPVGDGALDLQGPQVNCKYTKKPIKSKPCNSSGCTNPNESIYGMCSQCWDEYEALMNWETVKGEDGWYHLVWKKPTNL